nr:MAG TPA: hypothetical protein [Caudoviricetes sp.]
MEEIKTVVLAVIIAIVVCAAIFTSLDVFLTLSERKNACGRKPGYFNIGYRPEYGREFYRAHLVGVVERIGNVMLYIVEIHPRGRSQSARMDCPGGRAMWKAVTEERKIL